MTVPLFRKRMTLIDLSTLPSPEEDDAAHLEHGIKCCDIKREEVRRQFGTWVVTDYGLECLSRYYPIERTRLRQCDWPHHMAGKAWVDMQDFLDAYRYATEAKQKRKRTTPLANVQNPITPSLRFAVFKRDHYRCQLCGKSTADGVQLEIDHKAPRSKGGADTKDNLWTLCWECNRGKAAEDL